MNGYIKRVFAVLSPILFLAVSPSRADDLTVSAAISLKPALEEIAKTYERETKDKITYNFGGSGSLEQQIANGAPVDVFISAATKQIAELEGKGLLMTDTKRTLLKNSLVLVVPKGKPGISKFENLRNSSVKKIAVGDPKTVPAGEYAAEVFEKLNLGHDLSSKQVLGENVRQVLTFVETGNVDAGVVYLTDALGSKKVSVTAKADPSWHSPILYPIAVIKGTKHEKAARAFVTYLFQDEASKIFRKRGFVLGSDGKG